MSCCCNPFNPVAPSVKQVCGSFDVPTVPDTGRCFPYRVKRDCEAPTIQRGPCPGESPTAIYDPTRTPPFIISTGLYDQDCLPILDETGAQILTYI